MAYDNADQLYSAVQMDVASGSTLKRYGYIYDKAGNRTTEQIDDAVTTTTYNNANEMTSITNGGAPSFKGSVNELASVEVG